MAHIGGEILVKRPAEEVFDFVADERHEPRFNHHMLTAEKVSNGLIGKGTRFRAEIDNLGRAVPMDIEFAAVERPRRLTSSTHMTGMSTVSSRSIRCRREPVCAAPGRLRSTAS
jgi:uncharacterized protein YndB with AHSA1/START domain